MGRERKRRHRGWGLGGRRHHKADPLTGVGANECPQRKELPGGRVTLERAPAGQALCVTSLNGENGHAQRLRELGMFEGQTVHVLSAGNPLICKVGDCRLGMCKQLARCVLVEPLDKHSARSA